jgi:hypothetical protein
MKQKLRKDPRYHEMKIEERLVQMMKKNKEERVQKLKQK